MRLGWPRGSIRSESRGIIIERTSSAALQIDAVGTSAPLMSMYRYYFLDAADHVSATGLIDCETGEQVQARADRMLAGSDHAGIDVWDGGRRVYRADKSHPPQVG
jgi:hypothetical protein